jgi:PAS domain S-box-containing protein
VSGDNDKMGVITNCNAGALRIFGYTAYEMKNHHINRLMPDMYAKLHDKILEDALSKGPEGINSKERLVFAKHKSGYIFPVWL